MSKTYLFWSVLVVTVCVATGTAEEPGVGSVSISDLVPASSPQSTQAGNLLQQQHARAAIPEPYVVSVPVVVAVLPDESPQEAPVVPRADETAESDVCYGHQTRDSGCHHGTCFNCRPTAGDRMRAWWARTKACLQYSHWGYPEEFEERPFGTCVCAHVRTQISNGMAMRMVLYQYDFHDSTFNDPATLNPHGHKRLAEIAAMLQCDIWPAVIEPAGGNPQLDAARRKQVLSSLHEWIESVPEEWVVVASPETRALDGEEALEIYDNLIQQTRMGGAGAAAAAPARQTLITTVGPSGGGATGY